MLLADYCSIAILSVPSLKPRLAGQSPHNCVTSSDVAGDNAAWQIQNSTAGLIQTYRL